MDESPSVLTIGRRYMEDGYGFMFDNGKNIIRLRVKSHIPYLVANDNQAYGEVGDVTREVTNVLREKGGSKFVANKVVGDDDEDDDDAFDDAIPGEEEEEGAEEAEEAEVPEAGGKEEEEGEDYDIEVGMERGIGVRRKKGTLKAEANTLEHMITHRYANPYCDSCIRAKMRRFKTARGACHRKLKEWGDLVAFDFMTPEQVRTLGIDGDKEVLVIRDVIAGMRVAYPTSGNSETLLVGARPSSPTWMKHQSLWEHAGNFGYPWKTSWDRNIVLEPVQVCPLPSFQSNHVHIQCPSPISFSLKPCLSPHLPKDLILIKVFFYYLNCGFLIN